jgi:hypothetical protein
VFSRARWMVSVAAVSSVTFVLLLAATVAARLYKGGTGGSRLFGDSKLAPCHRADGAAQWTANV